MARSNIRVLALDLDGTLTNDEKIVTPRTRAALDAAAAQGVTIVLVEQNASRALQIADRGYVMESGLITMSGDARQMLDDPKVRAAYLGE